MSLYAKKEKSLLFAYSDKFVQFKRKLYLLGLPSSFQQQMDLTTFRVRKNKISNLQQHQRGYQTLVLQ